MEKLTLDLPLLLPDMDERDACVRLLTDRLAGVRGVEQVHFVRPNGTAQLCLHFNPNLVPWLGWNSWLRRRGQV